MANDADRLMAAIVLALVSAFRDPRRIDAQTNGLDERDLAFEAQLLDPPDVETARYVGHRRRGILRTYRHMESVGLLRLVDRKGIYTVFPTEIASSYYDHFTQPFWRRLFSRLRRTEPGPLSNLPRIEANQ